MTFRTAALVTMEFVLIGYTQHEISSTQLSFCFGSYDNRCFIIGCLCMVGADIYVIAVSLGVVVSAW